MPVHDCGTSQASGPPVLEAVPAAVTELLAPLMTCVVIGIGAGGATDGHVLVWHDLLGLSTGHVAKFVQRFADLRTDAIRGLRAYADAVRHHEFPASERTYTIPSTELDALRTRLASMQEQTLVVGETTTPRRSPGCLGVGVGVRC